MSRITVGVLASDNEDIIAECLKSAAWADELLVILDDRSSDHTAEIAQDLGAQVIPHRFEDFASQRNFGLEQTHTEWLFYLDSDERTTPALGQEVRQRAQEDSYAGWWVPRRNYIWGKETRHGGWYPDYQLRLLRVGRARYDPTRRVHEVVRLDGPEGYLQEHLLHYNYTSLAQFVAKQRQYVDLEAHIRLQEGVRSRPRHLLTQPLKEFWRRYITLEGYRDGWHGLKLCALVAYYYGFQVNRRLRQLRRAEG